MAVVPVKKEEDDPVYQLIQARQDELDKSIRELGDLTGVEHTTIAKQKRRQSEPYLSTIVDMAKAANVSPAVMFEAYLGKMPDPVQLKSMKLKHALAIYESHPEVREKLAYMVEHLIRETENLKEG